MFFTLAIVATVLAYVWFFEGRTARDYLPGATVVTLTFWHNVRHREWGFDWKPLRGASRLTAMWTAIAVTGIFVAGAMAGPSGVRRMTRPEKRSTTMTTTSSALTFEHAEAMSRARRSASCCRAGERSNPRTHARAMAPI